MRPVIRTASLLLAVALFASACGGGGSSSASDWCDLARGVDEASDAIDTASDPAAAFRELASRIDGLSAVAPSEIRDDVALMEEFAVALVAALDANDDNIILAMDEVTRNFDMNAVEAAGDNLTRYDEEVCGITDDDADADTDPGAGDLPSPGGTPGDAPDDVPDASGDPFEGGIIAGLADELDLTEDQARCLVRELDMTALMGGAEPDINQMMDAVATCGLDPTRIGG